jgi:transposase
MYHLSVASASLCRLPIYARWPCLLVESAWHYRRQPRMSKALRERSVGVSPAVCSIAWKAQKRLHNRLQRLLVRGKNPAEAITAVARELAGFVWAIAREEKLLAS